MRSSMILGVNLQFLHLRDRDDREHLKEEEEEHAEPTEAPGENHQLHRAWDIQTPGRGNILKKTYASRRAIY